MSGAQTLIGVATAALGLLLAAGATQISAAAGYAGVGPNFLPWGVAVGLVVCGGLLAREARSGGYREMDPPTGASNGHWPGFLWVSTGLLLNAALITTLGFILSCTLCFVFAVHGFKSAEGRLDLRPAAWLKSAAIGFAIAAPVYWMFSKLLAINLPGLTRTGWL